jgi:formate--tetrahydrofolate ligase
MDIKCGYAGIEPHAIVLVATIRALRHHGGAKKDEYNTPSLSRVKAGFENLFKHIENCKKFGITPIVAINSFYNDSEEEVNFIIDECAKQGVKAVVSKGFTEGGNGTAALAQEVVNAIESNSNQFKKLYDWNLSVEEKIKTIATEIYGADGVEYSNTARVQLKTITDLKLDKLPVCMAKTQKSLSDNESKIGRPRNFVINVREFEFAAGAGFIIPILGEMMRMPGLPAIPASEKMDIDISGKITGLS